MATAKPKKKKPAEPDVAETLKKASSKETAQDEKKAIIYRCIVDTFDAEGLNHIGSPSARIVWSTIDDPVILALGDGVTDCIRSKGYSCPLLAPGFQFLKNNNRVTVVSDLVDAIAKLVKP